MKIIYFLLIITLLATACKKDDAEPAQKPKTDKTLIILKGHVGSVDSFTIQFSGNWTLQVSPVSAAWLKPSLTSGKGNITLYVTAQQNNNTDTIQIAEILVIPEGNAANSSFVTVKQEKYSPVLWSKLYGGSQLDQVLKVKSTSDGGFIGIGQTRSISAELNGHGESDMWVVKVDLNGNQQWQKAFGGSGSDYGNDVVETSNGEFLVVGSTQSNNGDVSGLRGFSDIWLVKLDALGNKIWQKTMGGTKAEQAVSAVRTADDNIVIIGNSESSDGDVVTNKGSVDTWILKIDKSGSIIWQKTYGGSGLDEGVMIAQAPDGGFVAASITNSVDGDITQPKGLSDIWIIKTSGTGDLVWEKTYGGSNADFPHGVVVNQDGSAVISCSIFSSDGDITEPKGGIDAWIIKVNSSGNLVWQKTMGGSHTDQAFSMIATGDDGVIFNGYSSSNDGDLTGTKGDSDAWVCELDKNGTKKYSKTFGGSITDETTSIVHTQDGKFVIAGYSYSNDKDVSGNKGGADGWILKFEK